MSLMIVHRVGVSKLQPNALFKFFGNSFIEIEFTYHTIHLFEVYNSVIFLVPSKSCETITTAHFRTFSSPHKKTLYLAAVIPNPLSPRPPLIHFLSVQICVFWAFHLNVTIRYKIFVTGFFPSLYIMYSRLLHVGARLSTPFLLLDKYTTDIVQRYHVLFSHSSADGHVGGFPLWEMEQAFMAPCCPFPICCHSCLERSA